MDGNGRRWTGGEELEVHPSLSRLGRIWPADDENRPVTNGQQRSANAQLDSRVLLAAAGQATTRKALLRQRCSFGPC
jgi:hypothetical protein